MHTWARDSEQFPHSSRYLIFQGIETSGTSGICGVLFRSAQRSVDVIEKRIETLQGLMDHLAGTNDVSTIASCTHAACVDKYGDEPFVPVLKSGLLGYRSEERKTRSISD